MSYKKLRCTLMIFLISATAASATNEIAKLKRLFTAAIVKKQQYTYVGSFCPCPKGRVMAALEFSFGDRTKLLHIGNIQIRGKITPESIGAPLPINLKLTVKTRDTQRRILSSRDLVLRIQPNGVIAPQRFPVSTAFFLPQKQFVELTFMAVDKAIPASTVNLTIGYAAPPGS